MPATLDAAHTERRHPRVVIARTPGEVRRRTEMRGRGRGLGRPGATSAATAVDDAEAGLRLGEPPEIRPRPARATGPHTYVARAL
ncbi:MULTISPECIES: hypothetical protein [Streptomyces]|uniref:Uncharacterized protein n=1 Tax=Streptomyces flaveolus TaxID=67297 RepID=A0ABV1VE98_9ACTN